jgi:anti-sigma factor RsiW
MTEPRHDFDEALISGYLDGELTQGEAQRVRLHLEDCDRCRTMNEELKKLREATMTSEFQVPEDTGWDESPRSGLSRWLRNVGWIIGISWVVGFVAWLLWLVVTEAEDPLGITLAFGIVLAAGLILLSVLVDRLRSYRTDRYRRVKK